MLRDGRPRIRLCATEIQADDWSAVVAAEVASAALLTPNPRALRVAEPTPGLGGIEALIPAAFLAAAGQLGWLRVQCACCLEDSSPNVQSV